MIILAVTIILFLIFFATGKRTGATILAIIAGSFLDQLINTDVSHFISNIATAAPFNLISAIISLIFIVLAPLILYFRTDKIPRKIPKIIQAATLTLILLAFSSIALDRLVLFDDFSTTLISHLANSTYLFALVGFGVAYWDILFLRHDR